MLYLNKEKTPITAIVFDLGNVLIDYDPARFMFELGIPKEVIPRLTEIIDKRPEWAEYDRGILSGDDIIALAVRDEPSLRREITYYIKHRSECFSALPKNVDFLYRAKEAGARVYLLSNCMEEAYDYFLKHFIFLHDLDGAIISGQHKINKPDPKIYELLFKTYPDIDPPHTLYIDDVARNCEAGAEAGLIAFNLPKDGAIEDYLEITEE